MMLKIKLLTLCFKYITHSIYTGIFEHFVNKKYETQSPTCHFTHFFCWDLRVASQKRDNCIGYKLDDGQPYSV